MKAKQIQCKCISIRILDFSFLVALFLNKILIRHLFEPNEYIREKRLLELVNDICKNKKKPKYSTKSLQHVYCYKLALIVVIFHFLLFIGFEKYSSLLSSLFKRFTIFSITRNFDPIVFFIINIFFAL